MQIISKIDELRAAIKELRNRSGPSSSVGLIPTMGYLHSGHASLLHKARSEDHVVVLSIFVNPLQFGPNEDFDRYPRDQDRDIQLARDAGVDLLFMPSVQEMYPEYPLASQVTVGSIASRLCGASRPGHFDGVATVVLKLFQIVQPNHAYFGMKDAQQVAVISQVVRDFNVPVKIVPCPTIRENNGLALSSRNVYLSDEEKEQAVVLSRTLEEAGKWLDREKERGNVEELENRLRLLIETIPSAKVDYVSVLTYPSLLPLKAGIPISEAIAISRSTDNQLLVALAVKFGTTRLIDNRIFHLSEVFSHV